MLRLFTKMFAIVVVVVMINLGLAYATAYQEFPFARATTQRFDTLETAPSPKIVVVGGSNNIYGFNAERLGEALGYPVVNMGNRAPTGAAWLMSQVEDEIKSGDIVVLSMEWEYYYGLYYGRGMAPRAFAAIEPEEMSNLDNIEQLEMIVTGHSRYTRSALYNIFTIYNNPLEIMQHECSRGCPQLTNEYNDHLYPFPRPANPNIVNFRNPIRNYDPRMIEGMNVFAARMEAKGATVVMIFPPYPIEFYEETPNSINYAFQQLQENAEFPILGRPQDYLMPIDQFWDTAYHLAPDGREQRSDLLIERLGDFLDSQ